MYCILCTATSSSIKANSWNLSDLLNLNRDLPTAFKGIKKTLLSCNVSAQYIISIEMFRWSASQSHENRKQKKTDFPLQHSSTSKYYHVCVICVWIRSVLDSWLKRLEDFYLFHILLYKFVLLSLLYIKRMFQVHKE